jgi:hypothetical protein
MRHCAYDSVKNIHTALHIYCHATCLDYVVFENITDYWDPAANTVEFLKILPMQGPPLWSSGQSSGYRSRGPGSTSGATRFSEK